MQEGTLSNRDEGFALNIHARIGPLSECNADRNTKGRGLICVLYDQKKERHSLKKRERNFYTAADRSSKSSAEKRSQFDWTCCDEGSAFAIGFPKTGKRGT